jgi:hypothetical protein
VESRRVGSPVACSDREFLSFIQRSILFSMFLNWVVSRPISFCTGGGGVAVAEKREKNEAN